MNRRAFLAAAAAATGGLAGCSGAAERLGSTPSPTETVSAPPLAEQGRPPDVCEGDLVDLGIYAVTEPAFADDWGGLDVPEEYAEGGRLADDDVVVGLTDGDRARAYPLSVLWRHEIVNDVFPPRGKARRTESDDDFGGPVVVTYCSICRSGMVARRVVGGEPATFGVSGQLWVPPRLQTRASEEEGRVFAVEPSDADPEAVRNSGNLVMFDQATGSYWSQLLARAICGPREGDRLEVVPSTAATWADWREAHPGTDVLLPPPHSELMALPG